MQETILETDEENKLEEEHVSNPHISDMNLEEQLNSKAHTGHSTYTGRDDIHYNGHPGGLNLDNDDVNSLNPGFSSYINYIIASITRIELQNSNLQLTMIDDSH